MCRKVFDTADVDEAAARYQDEEVARLLEQLALQVQIGWGQVDARGPAWPPCLARAPYARVGAPPSWC